MHQNHHLIMCTENPSCQTGGIALFSPALLYPILYPVPPHPFLGWLLLGTNERSEGVSVSMIGGPSRILSYWASVSLTPPPSARDTLANSFEKAITCSKLLVLVSNYTDSY